jgi:streptogramin lyase
MNRSVRPQFVSSVENRELNSRAAPRAAAGQLPKRTRIGLFVWLALGILFFMGLQTAGAATQAVLTGIVSSDAEGPMEGVVVSAKRVGGTITIAVITDKSGRYSFPEGRLAPGEYQLTIRAVGYDPATPKLTATVGKGQSKTDIKLQKTHNLAAQMSNVEWLMSIPGTQDQKEWLSRSCVFCHNLTHIMESKYDAAGWMTTFARMANYSGSSTFRKPIPSPTANHEMVSFTKGDEEFGKYLASINLSTGPEFKFELKTLPRPRGEDTKVIITEYDLPRADAEPHDAVSDGTGMVWYCDFSEGIVGRLDPRTGKVKEWEGPSQKPGFPGGLQALELDSQGNSWVTRHEYNGFTKFDKKTEKFTDYSLPQDQVSPRTRTTFLALTRDDKVWVKDNVDRKIFLFDPKTGQFTAHNQYPDEIGKAPLHNIYGIRADSLGNEYGADIDGGGVAKIDVQSGKATFYPTPTPNAGPRRMHIDSENRLWIGEYYVNKIARFDTKTGQFQEWPHPVPFYDPYDVVPAKDGNIWTGGMNSDLIARFNLKTGEIRNYLMPRVDTNVRRVDVDNSGPRPVFWVGENHQGKIAKVEPLE